MPGCGARCYPDAMDVLVPMASQPTAMSGRNWVLRRMMIDAIKADPAWNSGNYTEQPPSFKYVATFFSLATAGGTQSFFRRAPTRVAADKLVEQRLAQKFGADANDYIYAYDAARDYDPSPGLEAIKARVLAINSADDGATRPSSASSPGDQAREERHLLRDPGFPGDGGARHPATPNGGSTCCRNCWARQGRGSSAKTRSQRPHSPAIARATKVDAAQSLPAFADLDAGRRQDIVGHEEVRRQRHAPIDPVALKLVTPSAARIRCHRSGNGR